MADSGTFQERFGAAAGRLLTQAETAVAENKPVVALNYIVRYLRAKRMLEYWDEADVAEVITQVEAS